MSEDGLSFMLLVFLSLLLYATETLRESMFDISPQEEKTRPRKKKKAETYEANGVEATLRRVVSRSRRDTTQRRLNTGTV
ncbi:hypothetical protein BDP67DRAFT_134066 [Colletotrichum lupini]|nr:hypothetical protein BDP67DRAFT_134066 [Colletotrichum lupini]